MKNKKEWRLNFSINNCNYYLMTMAIYDFIAYQDKILGHKEIREIISLQKNLDNLGTYMPKKQLRNTILKTLNLIEKKPDNVIKVHKITEDLNKELFKLCKELEGKNWSDLNDQELNFWYLKIKEAQQMGHGYANLTTWLIDSDGEDFSLFLKKNLLNKIANNAKQFNQYFSLLTSPEKISLVSQEELELLGIALEIKKIRKFKTYLTNLEILKRENNKLWNKIFQHYIKWRWLAFTYLGPEYELDYFINNLINLLKERNLKKRQIRMLNIRKEILEEKKKIYKKLKFTNLEKKYWQIASEIIYLKDYRKNCLYYGMYIIDKILRETCRRRNITLKQAWLLSEKELSQLILGKNFKRKLFEERKNLSAIHFKKEKYSILTGSKALELKKKLNIKKEIIKKGNSLMGTIAYPGKVKGIVRIINDYKEVNKISEGEIMISHTTFPALVPAMKKASAIVTNDGGITCHAAIVSREMKKPCIVGTKQATKFFKDGDKVLVNADEGLVKIINN